MTVKVEINDRDWVEAMIDAACAGMALTGKYAHAHDCACHMAESIGMRDNYVEDEILRCLTRQLSRS